MTRFTPDDHTPEPARSLGTIPHAPDSNVCVTCGRALARDDIREPWRHAAPVAATRADWPAGGGGGGSVQ